MPSRTASTARSGAKPVRGRKTPHKAKKPAHRAKSAAHSATRSATRGATKPKSPSGGKKSSGKKVSLRSPAKPRNRVARKVTGKAESKVAGKAENKAAGKARNKVADKAGNKVQQTTRENVISIRGAREHNLRNLNITLPRDKLIVMTGLSGSGKSSLAFDTIYAEGQRRYVESLSAYARQFLQLMEKPDVDAIDGLSPAISIEQKTTSRNPRSTVGTVTEIHDYLRLLFARIGVPYSPATGKPIESQTVQQMTDKILALPKGTRLLLLAPIVRGRKGTWLRELRELQKQGYQRIRVNGTTHMIEEVPALDKKRKHNLEVVVDRIVVADDLGPRLPDSLETVLALSDGLVWAEDADSKKRFVFSSRFACPVSGFTIEELEPRLFSFNSPFGACATCDGLGLYDAMDESRIVPDRSLPLVEAIAPWRRAGNTSPFYKQCLEALARHYKVKATTPWRELPAKVRRGILHGTDEAVKMRFERASDDSSSSYAVNRPFEGILPNLMRRWRETDSNWVREDLARFMSKEPCTECNGVRLKPQALAVKIDGKNISEVAELQLNEAAEWFDGLEKRLTPQQQAIAKQVLKEIRERLRFLLSVGLGYLTLARSSATLSGGESQRIRLASQIGSGLTGVLYVLDEPSIGLHARDNRRLLATLKRLRDLGNTVIVVEHDEEAMRESDLLVDLGPGAGIHGGKLVAFGSAKEVAKNHNSITADYLAGRKSIAVPSVRRPQTRSRQLVLKGANAHNLKNLTAKFPLGNFICVTGVSGGGKSSLVIETLYQALAFEIHGARTRGAEHKELRGLENVDKVIHIDQSPIGRTPRSNPATYTQVFSPIRDWFAALPEAKRRGWGPGRFSFNVKGGRCEACEGDGVLRIEMHFLPDVYVRCDQCKGKRYNRDTLTVRWRGYSIADILEMTVEEACSIFASIPAVANKLNTLQKVGLGYIHLGQQAPTLSGGEAQRVKLARELARRATGKTVYILDEPTTGLHFEDVRQLLSVLHSFADSGNTVIVIEHNLDVIKTADWILDLGPEGGDAGGEIVAEGTPEEVAQVRASHTGKILKDIL